MSFIPISEPEADASSPTRPPLVLIHDISGSIFPYTALGMLPPLEPYTIYGVSAPESEPSTPPPPPSLRAWAEVYAGVIAEGLREEAAARGGQDDGEVREGEMDVVLGGWSLGGLLAAEVARIYAAAPTAGEQTAHSRIRVRGVVLLDAHAPWSVRTQAVISDTTSSSEGDAGDAFLRDGTPYFSPSDIQAIYGVLARTTRASWPGMDGIYSPHYLITPTKPEARAPLNGLEEWFGEGRLGQVRRIAQGDDGCDHFSMMGEEWIERVGDALHSVMEELVDAPAMMITA